MAAAGRIVLPGVGAFADCMRGLTSLAGMAEALDEAVRRKARPFLGVCVGMQLMAGRGLEHGDHAGLGWVPGQVSRLEPAGGSLKIPHMGWNDLRIPPDQAADQAVGLAAGHPVLAGIRTGDHAYFVHSYGFSCTEPAHLLATVDYGGPVTAVIGRDNMVGTQFHPEKSQATGLRLITNFLKWRP